MRSYTKPVRQNGALIAYVQSVRSRAPIERGVAQLDRALLATIPVALVLAALSGAVLVGAATRPLRRMIDASTRLDRDLKGARLPVEGRDEFADLASGINAAFEKQGLALAQLERFTGDAGHELRTPLATIKTNASYLLHIADLPEELRPSARLIDAGADRMNGLIADLLLLARQDGGGAPLRRTATDVAELVRSAVENLAPRPGIEIVLAAVPGGALVVDPDAVERTLLNLLSNARDHACARVNVAATLDEGFLTLTVSDDGEGIAPEHLARLGERFYRPDEARSRQRGGVGLGVAIARSLAESHGGDLTIESQVSRGTVARARFTL